VCVSVCECVMRNDYDEDTKQKRQALA